MILKIGLTLENATKFVNLTKSFMSSKYIILKLFLNFKNFWTQHISLIYPVKSVEKLKEVNEYWTKHEIIQLRVRVFV